MSSRTQMCSQNLSKKSYGRNCSCLDVCLWSVTTSKIRSFCIMDRHRKLVYHVVGYIVVQCKASLQEPGHF